jgi:dTMP kinase
MRGRFITFEGGEGTGKSTQAAALAQRLRGMGIGVVLTREPGGSPGAEIIRHVILSGAAKPLGADAEAILLAAARDDHIATTIEPALARSRWVVSDRFADSTRVYQGALGRVDPLLIAGLNRITVGKLKPDLTFILDLPPEVGLERAKERRGNLEPDRFEGEALEFHEKLREAYLHLAASEPSRRVVIDAREPRAAVTSRIWETVARRLDPATAPVTLEDLAS